jgi:plastocyanin
MKRLIDRPRAIVRLLTVVLVAALPACGGSYGNGGTPANPTPPSPSPSPASGPPDVIVTVVGDATSMSYSPDPVIISAGQRIAWRNGDTMLHTATGLSQNGFDTREIAPGATSNAVAFTAAGDFAYRCNIHPTMVGTVTVR